MSDTIRPYGPGKFSTIVDSYIYEMSQEGVDEEIAGEGLGWSGLLRAPLYDPAVPVDVELNPAEVEYLSGMAGCVLHENTDGSVSVDYFTREAELTEAWAVVQQDLSDEEDPAGLGDADADTADVDVPLPVTLTSEMLERAEGEGRTDARHGLAGRGTTPSMERIQGWRDAWGVTHSSHPDEFGNLVDAWKRGVYREVLPQRPE